MPAVPALVRFLVCLSMLCVATVLPAKAQGVISVSKNDAQSYTGNVGPHPVRVNLLFAGENISGELHYTGVSAPLILAGKWQDNKIVLAATPMKNVPVVDSVNPANAMAAVSDITASMSSNGSLSGTLRISGQASYPLNLNRVFEVNYLDSSLNAAWHNTDPELKVDDIYTLSLAEPQFVDLPYRKKLRYINFWYSYRMISYMSKNNNPDLNSVGAQKLDEAGFPDGTDLMTQAKTFRHTQFPYHYRNGYSVAYIDPHLLSIKSDVYVYDGAPHAFTNETYKNYDLSTGDSLKLDSLFLRGGKYYLDSVGEICFRKQTGIGPGTDLAISGYFWNDSMFHVNTNFHFDIDGIWFVYNEYEIASYNYGITRIFIPYEMLKPIIRRRGPLGWVLKDD